MRARVLLPGASVPARRDAGPRRLPDTLDAALLARTHGPVLGRALLWVNRARVRHQLSRLAEEAPDARLADMGLSRAHVAREAARWFWEDMETGAPQARRAPEAHR